jgi:hypothetical protein
MPPFSYLKSLIFGGTFESEWFLAVSFPIYCSLRPVFRFTVNPIIVLFLCLYFPLILHYIRSYLSCTLYFSPDMLLCIKPAMSTVCPCIYCCPHLAYFCTLKVWWHMWQTLFFNPCSCLTHLVFMYKLDVYMT